MERPFEQRYAEVERAYAEGHFQVARDITLELLGELDPLPEAEESRMAALLWQAHLSLLLGHIQLYGFQEINAARQAYGQVLAVSQDTTLQELANQGLQACEAMAAEPPAAAAADLPDSEPVAEAEPAATAASQTSATPTTTAAVSPSAIPEQQTRTAGSEPAMPWLEQMAERPAGASAGLSDAPDWLTTVDPAATSNLALAPSQGPVNEVEPAAREEEHPIAPVAVQILEDTAAEEATAAEIRGRDDAPERAPAAAEPDLGGAEAAPEPDADAEAIQAEPLAPGTDDPTVTVELEGEPVSDSEEPKPDSSWPEHLEVEAVSGEGEPVDEALLDPETDPDFAAGLLRVVLR
ncbi:hypothetical protein EVJ50_10160 [Synechococcus sp. RSCCF101]|uniref:hypothetical protein n=1 Tax=Synechococcus sp. RSCCF101 TaxID=2511069 RepID=UPI0012488C42|nr:hypothetical protein [Synechococcus sp. RSCCF101]QEY32530.1 hypothetical protein EVJ50_10160 [Synechococcus sp. RSCCF101]